MRNYLLVTLLTVTFASSAAAQTIDLEAFLTKAREATVNYRNTFKNLVAEEQRTIKYFREDETIDEIRRVKSVFVVYESPTTHSTGEFRNVIEFNGKNVARKDADVGKFFEKLSNTQTSYEEMTRLSKEGNRFDGKSS